MIARLTEYGCSRYPNKIPLKLSRLAETLLITPWFDKSKLTRKFGLFYLHRSALNQNDIFNNFTKLTEFTGQVIEFFGLQCSCHGPTSPLYAEIHGGCLRQRVSHDGHGGKVLCVVVQEKPKGSQMICSLGTSRSNTTTNDEGDGIDREIPNDDLLLVYQSEHLAAFHFTHSKTPPPLIGSLYK